jgi:hypothetical protein
MKPIDVIRAAQSKALTDEDGEQIELSLLPGLDDAAVQAFEASLPCPLPAEIRDLLHFCRGFEGVVADLVDFTGQDTMFEQRTVFPHGVPIASDGFGNFWVVDLSSASTIFGPIWFACHDPPVILYQSADVTVFLAELFKTCQPPYESLVDDVHEDRLRNVWRTNPGVLTYGQCAQAADDVLREFAAGLDASYQVIDLRKAEPGDGFSWGRYGPRTVIRRHGAHPVFAYQQQKKNRLFGGLFGG